VSADEAAAFGLTVDEAGGPDVIVWPDNLPAVNCFIQLGTQWRVGMAGATGLDYAAVPFVMRTAGIPRAEWHDVFDSIRTLEAAALETMKGTK